MKREKRIDELIAELCPDGVEYKPLGDVCVIKNGKDYKSFSEGTFPVYGSGGIMTYVDRYVYDKPTVLIPRKGSIENLFYVDVPFWNVDTVFYTEIKTDVVFPKYLYYYMTTVDFSRLNNAGGVPSLTQTGLYRVSVAVPPLAVQKEIVRILDGFTGLIAELEAERGARRKQIEQYREKLLTFGDEVERKSLGEIAEIIRGGNLQKNDFTETGTPCVHYGQIYTHFGLWSKKVLTYVNSGKAVNQRFANPGDLIMAVTSETVEDVCKCFAWIGDTPVAVSGHTAIIRHNQNPQFLSCYFHSTTFIKQKRKLAHGVKVIEVTPEKLKEIKIPVPPLEDQKRIVTIFEKFDALCNDETSGLVAEIAARKKQYEYYREKLLTFKRKETA